MTDAIYSLAINPVMTTILYTGTWGQGIYKSTNGGASWKAMNSGLPSKAYVRSIAINHKAPSTLYASTGDPYSNIRGALYMSTDGGAHWNAVNSGLPLPVYVSSIAIDPVTPSIIYSGTGRGVYKSTKGGITSLFSSFDILTGQQDAEINQF